MNVKLLTEQHLEFLSLKGGCSGLSESTLVKMPYCWKSRVAAHLYVDKSPLGIIIEIISCYILSCTFIALLAI